MRLFSPWWPILESLLPLFWIIPIIYVAYIWNKANKKKKAKEEKFKKELLKALKNRLSSEKREKTSP